MLLGGAAGAAALRAPRLLAAPAHAHQGGVGQGQGEGGPPQRPQHGTAGEFGAI